MSDAAQRTQQSKLAAGILILAAICLGSGAGVGLLYWRMQDEIEAKAQSVFRETLALVLGEAEGYDVVGHYPAGTPEEQKVYLSRAGPVPLYAAVGTAKGYSSVIKVLVSVQGRAPGAPVGPDPRIRAVAVVASQETPGLGENIKAVEKDVSLWGKLAGAEPADGPPKRPWFQEQFSGLRLSDLPAELPAAGQVEAITGATITSNAAVRAVREAVTRTIEATEEAYGG